MTDAASGSSKRLLSATAVMASGTMVSRILGFVRTMLVAFALGNVTTQGDTFTLATVVPNNLYMIFAGGALNTVLVPQIVRHIRSDADGGVAFINRIMTAFLMALAVVTAFALVFTPQVMSLWMGDAWTAGRLAGHRDALFFLAYLTMPQLFFYGAFFLIGQVLNARDKFGPMMWAPIVNNLVQIVVLGGYAIAWASQSDHSVPFTREQVLVLGVGSTVGIIAQTLVLIPAMRALGLRYRPRFDLRGSGLGATFHLAKWAIGYVVLTQLAAVVVTRLASAATIVDPAKPGPGLLAYNEAYLTWILPHSLLTVSLATALLPSASRLAAAGDLPGVAGETSRTLRLANTFIVPAAVGLGVLANPFANLVFGNGAGASDWHAVALTLMCFAVGLVPYTIQYVYLRGFYALESMRTVFGLQIWISGANALLAWGWVQLDPNPLTVAPRLALAYSISYLLGAFITFRSLARRLPDLGGGTMLGHVVRVLAATLPGAALAWGITAFAADRGKPIVAAGFVVAGLVFGGLFIPLARLLGLSEVAVILDAVARRLGLRRGRGGVRADDWAPGTDEGDVVASELTEADAIRLTPLLNYPDPDAPISAPEVDADAFVQPGDVLDRRYRLDRLLVRRGQALTWLARDQTLSRPVLLHVLPAGAPRALEVLDAARESGRVLDSRFLRVWDAVLVEGQTYGAMVPCEYAPGQSLELALRRGAMSEIEACWIVRQLAEGLIALHADGLYHRHLNPDTVVITASGNVKIVGFLLEEALAPSPDGGVSGERADVRGLGLVLFASLLGCWPDGPAYGLPESPRDARGRVLAPGELRPELSDAVADVIDRILTPIASPQPPLQTASAVASALADILQGADASRLLEQRLQYPIPLVATTRPALPHGATPIPPPVPVVRPQRAVLASTLDETAAWAPTDEEEETRTPTAAALPQVSTPAPPAPVLPAGQRRPLRVDAVVDADAWDDPGLPALDATAPIPFPFEGAPSSSTPSEHDELSTPIPAPTPERDLVAITQPRKHFWFRLLIVCFLVALVAGMAGVFVNQYRASRPVAPVHTPIAIVGVRDFDPKADGGDDSENGTQAALATDGQAGTLWKTEKYGKSAAFNGRKPGVGLLLDLGSVQTVTSVRVTVATGPTDLEIRVPAGDPGAASMATQKDWRVVASGPGSLGESTLTPTKPVQTRYVLVYITKLPDLGSGAGFQAAIADISVSS